MSATFIPQGDQWKDPWFVEKWERGQKQRDKIERDWERRLKYEPFLATPQQAAREAVQDEFEGLSSRARRLEPGAKKSSTGISPEQARHQVPAMLAKDQSGWILHPGLKDATPAKVRKAESMYDQGLVKKAQREIACGILGGEVECRGGHKFQAPYRCGNRYCSNCAPIDGKKLFARQHDRILCVATRLMRCGPEGCEECAKAVEEKRLPHWPPPPRSELELGHPKIVCATIDFTYWHDRFAGMPTPDVMRRLNSDIKKWCRLIEKRFGISRKEYGLAYCDEFGVNNSNPHAHAIYVGPWLPQSKLKLELSELWREATGGQSHILYIQQADSFTAALFHAVKYTQKFATRSNPERLADLEVVFHRVRRFHALASFYNPKDLPPKEVPPVKRCPICDEQLSVPRGWNLIAELSRRGLRDVEQIRAEINRERGLGDESPP
jgi:hypothetical protein